MESHILEWLNLGVRWLHVTTGVAWIGASFYFNWLENHLNRRGNRKGIAGHLWAVHGGGFYYLEKYQNAPKEIPRQLHWFKYEAYFTWISGVCLLAIVYYWNSKTYLIDPAVRALSPAAAVGIGAGSLVVSWWVYDLLCKSPLIQYPRWFAAGSFGLVTVLAFGFTQVFSARGAYIHVGAVLGTLMAVNVFAVIIPSQKKMVASARRGAEPDPAIGQAALKRSLHNNYMTLPVLFIMISNHFPSTYGNALNWAVLAGLMLTSAAIRHYFNLRGRGHYATWILPVAALAILALALITSPRSQTLSGRSINIHEAQRIVQNRCVSCHAARPTDDVFKVPPLGVALDSIPLIRQYAARIKVRIDQNTMPLLNKTKMTTLERQQLSAWAARETNR